MVRLENCLFPGKFVVAGVRVKDSFLWIAPLEFSCFSGIWEMCFAFDASWDIKLLLCTISCVCSIVADCMFAQYNMKRMLTKIIK